MRTRARTKISAMNLQWLQTHCTAPLQSIGTTTMMISLAKEPQPSTLLWLPVEITPTPTQWHLRPIGQVWKTPKVKNRENHGGHDHDDLWEGGGVIEGGS